MGRDFKSHSSAVMEHISRLGRGTETQRAYTRCFSLLGTYLDVRQQPYSPELADLWLNSVKGQTNKVEFGLFNAAIRKANDLFLYGEIHKNHFDSAKHLPANLALSSGRYIRISLSGFQILRMQRFRSTVPDAQRFS